VRVQGVHEFHSGDFSATAYSCVRSGTRVLCVFDITKRHAEQSGPVWNQMKLVREGGKISKRADAFYVFEDGSQDKAAYLSATPVRMIMVFDNVSPNATSATLSSGQDRADSVPITAEENQTPTQAQQPAAAPANQAANNGRAKGQNATQQQRTNPQAQPHP
jgi:hypothetical protein